MESTSYDSPLHEVLETEFRTTAGLAKAAGIERSKLHHIVHGRRPSYAEATAIASALGRPLDDLWPGVTWEPEAA